MAEGFPARLWGGPYLQLYVGADILPRVGVVEEVEDGGDQRFVHAVQPTANHVLQDGAQTAALGHHRRVQQGCNTV